jgi:phenylacetate-coenzyme A ligase PaaK-like adenylate-forming protein
MPPKDAGPEALERARGSALARYRRECLRRLIPWARRTPFYRRHLARLGTAATVKDIVKAPLTSKEELLRSMGQGRFPANCWCPIERLTFIGSTGGPGTEALAELGLRPLPVPLRPVDLARRAGVAARAFRMAAGRKSGPTALLHEVSGSVVHQAMLRGLALLGARPAALGRGSTARHVRETFGRLGASDLVTHPTYATFLVTLAGDAEVELRFRRLFLWGEVGGSVRPVRERLSKAFGAKVHDIYAMQELGVLATECSAGRGLHGFEDQFVYEVVDPSTGEPLDDGKVGELVVTDLHRSAFPLIRYRTGDMTSIERGTCRCGRTALRLTGIKGRATDAILGEDGRRVYPADMLGMLEGNPHVTGVFRVVPGLGAFLETKEHKGMADHYLDRFGRPPDKVTFERVMPRFLHRTEYVVNGRYERLLREQIGREG